VDVFVVVLNRRRKTFVLAGGRAEQGFADREAAKLYQLMAFVCMDYALANRNHPTGYEE
jgi:hypothetical protein